MFHCADGSEPYRLDQGEEFVFVLPAPPDDGRCVAGWAHEARGGRCENKATMPDLCCLECHLAFRRTR